MKKLLRYMKKLSIITLGVFVLLSSVELQNIHGVDNSIDIKDIIIVPEIYQMMFKELNISTPTKITDDNKLNFSVEFLLNNGILLDEDIINSNPPDISASFSIPASNFPFEIALDSELIYNNNNVGSWTLKPDNDQSPTSYEFTLKLTSSKFFGFEMNEKGWLSLALDLKDEGHANQIVTLKKNVNNQIEFEVPPKDIDFGKTYSISKEAPQEVETPNFAYTIHGEASGDGASLKDQSIIDTLPSDLVLTKLSKITNDQATEISTADYTFENNTLNYKVTDDITNLKLQLDVSLSDEAYEAFIANGNINTSYKNKALLTRENDSKVLATSDSVTTKMIMNFFNKDGNPSSANGKIFDWSININTNFNNVASEHVYIIDTIEDISVHNYNINNVTINNNSFIITDKTNDINALINTDPSIEEAFKYDHLTNANLMNSNNTVLLNALNILTNNQTNGFYYKYSNGNEKNQAMILFPITSMVNQALTLKYQSNVTDQDVTNAGSQTLENKVKLIYNILKYPGDGDKNLPDINISTGVSKIANYELLTKTGGNYNHAMQILDWDFKINLFGATLDNIKISDEFINKKQLLELSDTGKITLKYYDIASPSPNPIPIKTIEITSNSSDDNHFTINSTDASKTVLSIQLKDIPNTQYVTFTIPVKIVDGDLLTTAKFLVENTAKYSCVANGQSISEKSANGEKTIDNPLIKKTSIKHNSLSYNYNTHEIFWKLEINENNLPINNLKINEVFLDQVFKRMINATKSNNPSISATISDNGTTATFIDGSILKFENNTFIFPDTINETYIIEYSTIVDAVYRKNNFHNKENVDLGNTATLVGEIYDKDIATGTNASANAKITIPPITKSGEFNDDKNNCIINGEKAKAALINWELGVNADQVDRSNEVITDSVDSKFEIDVNSVKVYTATLSNNGSLTKDTSSEITNMQSIKTALKVTNKSLEFTIPTIYAKTPLIITYKTFINESMNKEDMKNTVSLGSTSLNDFSVTANSTKDFKMDDFISLLDTPFISIDVLIVDKDTDTIGSKQNDVDITLTPMILANDTWVSNTSKTKLRMSSNSATTRFLYLGYDTLYKIEQTEKIESNILLDDPKYVIFKSQSPSIPSIPYPNNTDTVDFGNRNYSFQFRNLPNNKVLGKIIIQVTREKEDGTFVSGGKDIAVKINNTTLNSDVNGRITISDLPLDVPVVITPIAPNNSDYSSVQTTQTITPTFSNPSINADIQILLKHGSISGKVIDNNNKPLQNALVGLFKQDETTFIRENCFKKYSVYTNSNGDFNFNNIPLNSYKVHQIQAPNGYDKKEDTTYDVSIINENDIITNDNSINAVDLIFVDIKKPSNSSNGSSNSSQSNGSIVIKIDVPKNLPNDYVIRVTYNDIVTTYYPNSQSVIYLPNLINGTYTIDIISSDGTYKNTQTVYIENNDKSIFFTPSEQVIQNTTQVSFIVSDKVNKQPLPNTIIQILNELNEVVATLTTNNFGQVTINLPIGVYHYTIVKLPNKYQVTNETNEIIIKELEPITITNSFEKKGNSPDTSDNLPNTNTLLMLVQFSFMLFIGSLLYYYALFYKKKQKKLKL